MRISMDVTLNKDVPAGPVLEVCPELWGARDPRRRKRLRGVLGCGVLPGVLGVLPGVLPGRVGATEYTKL